MTDPTFPAPYAPDTLAKGWRFEIDLEKVERSDTWFRAKTGAVRGALLLLWSRAWMQTPCGTLPNDDELVALLIDMPQAAFVKNRAVLMRGWRLADDGRLYHETITDRVLAMLDKRKSDAVRSAESRARRAASKANNQGVTGASHVTHTGLTSEFDTKHQAPGPDTEPSGSGKAARKPRATSPPVSRPDDVSEQVWADWCALRTKKRATVSETAIGEARKEAAKAAMPLERFLAIWCARGSQGLEASWLRADERAPQRQQPAESFRERDIRDAEAKVAFLTGRKPQAQQSDFIDVEATDVTPRRLG